jgi:UDP-GlcNAc:undecaprenyl-phosphate GlcNAc-1-phosphate transferase
MAAAASSIVGLCCFGSAVLTGAIACYAGPISSVIGLVDRPDGIRKLHDVATPLIGGVALLIPAFGVSIFYLTAVVHAPFMLTAVIASALTLVIGLMDDRWGLSPVWRLLALTFIAFSVLSIEPLFAFHSLRLGFFGINVALGLDPIAAPVTVLLLLGFVNASNMADGMNGQLLGSIAIWCLFVSYHLGVDAAVPLLVLLCSALVTLAFNLRGRLFSGSSGAYAASLFIALAAIAAYRRSNGVLPGELPIYWFWLPLVDCLRLMVVRIHAGKSPLAGDRNHIHHILQQHMRVRYALPIYLGLLAAPGVAAEINIDFGSPVLLICVSIYLAFVSLHGLGLISLRRNRTRANAPQNPSRCGAAIETGGVG